MQKINLPKKYEYIEGESRTEYKKYEGWNKLSHSQFTSFSSSEYKGNYIIGYFVGKKDDGNIFSQFGNDCGDYLNRTDQRVAEYLTDECKAILDKIERPENAQYEYEILIDLEPFGLEKTVMQGFSDIQYEVAEKTLNVHDYKTLTLAKKRDHYASKEYQQLNLYGYGLEELGFKINKTSVFGLGRGGNCTDKSKMSKAGKPLWLHLTGEVEEIPRDYSREEAIEFLKEVVETCKQIDEYYKLYLKYLVK